METIHGISCTATDTSAYALAATWQDVTASLGQQDFNRATALLADLPRKELNSIDENGWTLLHHGVAYRDPDFVSALLKVLDPSTICRKNKNDITALRLAVEVSAPELVCSIAPFFEFDDLVEHLPLCEASLFDFLPAEPSEAARSLAREIQAAMCRIVAESRDARALLASAATGEWHLAQELIAELPPTELAAVNKYGDTALHLALRKGEDHVACQLILRMDPIDLIKGNNSGETPIEPAFGLDSDECLELILEKIGPLLKAADPQCLLPNQFLLHATALPIKEFASSLIQKLPTLMYAPPIESEVQLPQLSAEVTINTKEFEQYRLSLVHSAMVAAQASGWDEGALALMERLPDECLSWRGQYPAYGPFGGGYKSKTLLQAAAKTGSVDVVKQLVVRLGPECLETRFKEDSNPLHLAARGGHVELCAALLEWTADKLVLQIDEKGKTPLHLACCNRIKGEQNIPLLIQAMQPADLGIKDKDEHTALAFLLQGRRMDDPSIGSASYLIRHMEPGDLVGRCF
ncbi:MAG: ankyrin repeat domain-containing protein, partial [Chlamydiia bacterium]|nr:ankyrin repeat domain-containing protein [Chlamydiia bacterium]